MRAGAHQSGGGILMATATSAINALAATNQMGPARGSSLSEGRPSAPADLLSAALLDAAEAASGNQSAHVGGPAPGVVFSGWDLLLISVLISIILISIVGNLLVCVAIFTDRRLRKLGNAFIVSLAIADLFVSCLVMTFALCNDLMNYWMFGEWFCDIWISFDIMCCTASILNLCAISLDRFIHIKDCLLYNQLMTRRVAISAVIIIWIISALVSFVPINLGWHKPNHFKQPSAPASQAAHLADFSPANLSLNPILSGGAREPERDYDGADDNTAANKLALIGQADRWQDAARDHRAELAGANREWGPVVGERHKRQAAAVAAAAEHSIIETSQPIPGGRQPLVGAGPEPDDKISEIRAGAGEISSQDRLPLRPGRLLILGPVDERSQIANKLERRPSSGPHQASASGSVGSLSTFAERSARDTKVAGARLHAEEPSEGARQKPLPGRRRTSQAAATRPGPVSARAREQWAPLESAAGLGAAQVPQSSLEGPGRGNNLSRAPEQSNDDVGGGESKQAPVRGCGDGLLAVHENELFDQVAAAAALKSNPEAREDCRGQHVGSVRQQIKHLPRAQMQDGRAGAALLVGGTGGGGAAGERASGGHLPSARTIRSPRETDGGPPEQTDRDNGIDGPGVATAAAAAAAPDKVDGPGGGRATAATHHRSRSAEGAGAELSRDNQRTATGRHKDQTGHKDPHPRPRASPRRATIDDADGHDHDAGPKSSPTPNQAQPRELPQCMLTLTPTYAVISSTISFYIPCIIMLGLYSKLFACARRHVRNIKAISKAPQPIGYGAPVRNSAALAGGQATNAVTYGADDGAAEPGGEQAGKLARIVRRPELNLADKSRTWIKFGRRGRSTSRPSRSGETEPALSTSSSAEAAKLAKPADAAANKKAAQSSCSPVLMKLSSTFNKTKNAQTTTSSQSAPDYAAGGSGGARRDIDYDKTIAQGNEAEPFLNGQTAKGSPIGDREGARPTNRLHSGRPDASGGPDQPQIITTTYAAHEANPNSNHGLDHTRQQASKQQTSQLATHKAAITLGIIMGTFLFCWVPFFCLNIIKAYHGDSIPSSLFRAFTWLGYANSALNPIIYGIHNSEFRNAFNRIFFKHLTLKNGRQYLNRRFSYDLRPHHQGAHRHHQHANSQQQARPNHGDRQDLSIAQQQNQLPQPNQRFTPSPTTTCERDMTFSQTQPPVGCSEVSNQPETNSSQQYNPKPASKNQTHP